jgi:hypothetical protein
MVVPLTERAIAGDGSIAMRLIKPGWGASGYYSKEVLERDGPSVWPPGTHMYLDHPTETEMRERPERSVRDLAAVTISPPVYEESGKAGPGLYAKATVLPQWRQVIEALAPYIGVSIRASGTYESGEAEGRNGKLITALRKGHSIDFVTKPGAGGQVLAVMESLRQGALPQNESADVLSSGAMMNGSQTESITVATTTTTGTGTLVPSPVIETAAQQEEDMELQEARERIHALEEELEESTTACKEATVRAERAEGALAILEAQGAAREALENVSLPAAAKTRIITKVSTDPKTTDDGKLDRELLAEAVAAEAKLEAEYIESITVTGKVTDQGSVTPPAADEARVKESLASNLSKFFNLGADAAKQAADRH